VSGKTTPETCGKQLENLWAEIEAVVRGLGGWVGGESLCGQEDSSPASG